MSREDFPDPRPAIEVLVPADRSPKGKPTTRVGGTLARIYQSLSEFTVLTDHLRRAVDERLGAHLEVTGWQDGILRVRLDQPALATRWRFQEPAVRRNLARVPALRELRDIRLVLEGVRGRPAPARAGEGSRLGNVPVEALRDLAGSEPHEKLRRALALLADEAERARHATGRGA